MGMHYKEGALTRSVWVNFSHKICTIKLKCIAMYNVATIVIRVYKHVTHACI